jgi:predicted PhzF superfamily epimerase YddE/YHI9
MSFSALQQITPDLKAIASLSEELEVIGFYPISRQTEVTGRTISARMFAPFYGIDEVQRLWVGGIGKVV